MAEVWLVRHAQSMNNALGEAHRQPDPPLTDLGNQQAQRLAKHLQSESGNFDQFFVSAFRRALQTAAPVAKAWNANAHVWVDLHEVGGCYDGMAASSAKPTGGLTPKCIEAEFSWAKTSSDWVDGGWNRLERHESVSDAIPRTERVAEELIAKWSTADQRLILVSHGEFIALLLTRILHKGFPDPKSPFFVRPRSIYNTAISKVKLTPKGCQLIEFNQVCHLSGSELSS